MNLLIPSRQLLAHALWAAVSASLCAGVQAQGADTVEVRAERESMSGLARSASEGIVSGERLRALPLLRPGEVLEMVPGLMVTQHAGDGKANQYFLRGFNLDHGTDFATFVGGMPVNMPSHAHGQGYTDLNFLIPGLVQKVHYQKGPYDAQNGDFGSAGTAHIDYLRQMDSPLAQVTLGQGGFARSLLAGSPSVGSGKLLYGLEVFRNDGPWQTPEDYRKLNGVLRYSEGSTVNGYAVSAMAYRGRWTSTDQVPQRAIDRGLISRFGSLDSTTGGHTQRYSLSGEWAWLQGDTRTRANAWWLQSSLDLWSNFQYCLSDPVTSCPTGDQFMQREQRQAVGLSLSQSVPMQWGDKAVENSYGLQARQDHIAPVGLYGTRERVVLSTVREDQIQQRSVALWFQNEVRWLSWLRSTVGLRGDAYQFDVQSSLSDHSGQARAHMVSPKLGLVLGPWHKAELYLNHGHGFHSNDARGTTQAVDPVSPLVRTRASEVGVRWTVLPGWKSTVSLWQLQTASELLFVGDAGTTEPSRPSRRSGLEWGHFARVGEHVALDADLSWSRARFTDADAAGPFIPGAVSTTANLGITLDAWGPWSTSFRLRYFGPRPLIEDNSVKSAASWVGNLRVAYRVDARNRLSLDVFNLFNTRSNDIDYFYASRLAGESAPVWDRHVHPAEPRMLRLSWSHRFD
ncbi:MAG: hypothetical protein RLZZ464_1988 [Pseudomonadota bacterium]|jgi:hypothetical protein